MGQARAQFTEEGMVDSKVTMGEPMPRPIEMTQGTSTVSFYNYFSNRPQKFKMPVKI